MVDNDRAPECSSLGAAAESSLGLGSAVISMIEPAPGYARAYNRWHEDDHFLVAMAKPGVFAGRLWMAPPSVVDLWSARDPKLAPRAGGGCFLSTYWIAPGRLDHYRTWTSGTHPRLVAEGRIDTRRRLIHKDFLDRIATVPRGADVVPDVYSLLEPSASLIVELHQAANPASRASLQRTLIDAWIPARVAACDAVSQAIVFRTAAPNSRPRDEAPDGRVTVLWFLDDQPSHCWAAFRDAAERFGGDAATLRAVFIPSVMGTDAHVDQFDPAGGNTLE